MSADSDMVMRAARGIARKFSGGKSENPNGAEIAAARAALDASGIGELVEALTAISGQAICYGMAAEENELRDWLKFISETAETALSRARATQETNSE
jgi:hypothetical protein